MIGRSSAAAAVMGKIVTCTPFAICNDTLGSKGIPTPVDI